MLNAALLFMLAIQVESRCDSDFLHGSWALLEKARWGFSKFERAAFAVRESDGHIDFVRWPDPDYLRAVYRGSVPANAVAIVHTHPNNHPDPSSDDDDTARRLGIPVYVVTRNRVSFTTGHETRIVVDGDWNPDRCR